MQLDAHGAGDISGLEFDFGHGGESLRDGVERGGDVVVVSEEGGWRRGLGAQRGAGYQEQGS